MTTGSERKSETVCKVCYHKKFKYKPTTKNLIGIDKCKCKCHYSKKGETNV